MRLELGPVASASSANAASSPARAAATAALSSARLCVAAAPLKRPPARLVLLGVGGRGSGPQQRSADGGRGGREERADEEGSVVAAGERHERAVAGGGQALRAGGGEAGQDGEPERPAHHERGVDDPGGEPGLARLDVAHRGEQHGVEGDPGADAEQEHGREHVDEEVAVDRRPREEQRARPRPARGRPRAAA